MRPTSGRGDERHYLEHSNWPRCEGDEAARHGPLKLKGCCALVCRSANGRGTTCISWMKWSVRGDGYCAPLAATGKNHWFEADHLKPFLKGSLDIRRYGFSGAAKHLIFPYRNTAKESLLILRRVRPSSIPLTWAYLLENRSRLARREKGTLGAAWHGYGYKKNHLRFEQPKILAPAIAPGACFAWDEAGSYYFVGSVAAAVVVMELSCRPSIPGHRRTCSAC